MCERLLCLEQLYFRVMFFHDNIQHLLVIVSYWLLLIVVLLFVRSFISLLKRVAQIIFSIVV